MNQFQVGQKVRVLRASRLPIQEEIHRGVIMAIDNTANPPLYWVDKLPMARSAEVLRLVEEGE